MTAAESVEMTADCDRCGAPDATWMGLKVPLGESTLWEVVCNACTPAWTVAAQRARRTETSTVEPVSLAPWGPVRSFVDMFRGRSNA